MNHTEMTLTEAAFIADELRLFLDTHPENQNARADYRNAAAMVQREKNESDYAISSLDAGKGSKWDWTSTPWPWEKGE